MVLLQEMRQLIHDPATGTITCDSNIQTLYVTEVLVMPIGKFLLS